MLIKKALTPAVLLATLGLFAAGVSQADGSTTTPDGANDCWVYANGFLPKEDAGGDTPSQALQDLSERLDDASVAAERQTGADAAGPLSADGLSERSDLTSEAEPVDPALGETSQSQTTSRRSSVQSASETPEEPVIFQTTEESGEIVSQYEVSEVNPGQWIVTEERYKVDASLCN